MRNTFCCLDLPSNIFMYNKQFCIFFASAGRAVNVDFYKCKCEKEDHYNKSQTKPLGFNRPLTLLYGWSSVVRQERSTLEREKRTTYAYATGLASVSNFAIYIFVVEMCAVLWRGMNFISRPSKQ